MCSRRRGSDSTSKVFVYKTFPLSNIGPGQYYNTKVMVRKNTSTNLGLTLSVLRSIPKPSRFHRTQKM